MVEYIQHVTRRSMTQLAIKQGTEHLLPKHHISNEIHNFLVISPICCEKDYLLL